MAAAWPKERLGQALTKDQVVALKLERLRKVMEGFPGTLWAKRAGLLSGVILIDRNPAWRAIPSGSPAGFSRARRLYSILDRRGLAAPRGGQGGGQYV